MNNVEIETSVVLFAIRNIEVSNYRKLSEKKLSVLLLKDGDTYHLPFYKEKENLVLEDCANKAVLNETNIKDFFIEQLYTFSHIQNGTLILNPTYLGLIPYEQTKKDNSKGVWFDCFFKEKNNIVEATLTSEIDTITFSIKKTLKKGSSDRYLFSEEKMNKIKIGDGATIISAIERLKNKINYTDIVFNIMPKLFTLKELQKTFEVIENKKLLDAAFRRIIIPKVVETNEYLIGKGCRPSKLYKYKGAKENEKN